MKIFSFSFLIFFWVGLLHAQDCNNDTKAPLTRCLRTLSFTLDAAGSATILAEQLNGGSVDNCSSNLKFSFSSDVEDKERTFTELGIYTIDLWTTDEAENQSTCEAIINIVNCDNDTKAPTARCKSLVQFHLEEEGTVMIFAEDLDAGSTDDCSTNLRFSFSSDVEDNSKTFNEAVRYFLDFWVTDEAGNQTYCEMILDILNCENDDLPPVVVCQTELSVELDETGVFTLFPEDLDDGSRDNCTTDLEFSFVTDGEEDQDFLVFEEAGIYGVTLKIVDEGGNDFFCWATIYIDTNLEAPCEQIPTNLEQVSEAENQVTLSWSALPGVNNYILQGRAKGSTTWALKKKVFSNTFVVNRKLTIGQVYEWRVRTNCGKDTDSPFSEIQSFTYGSEVDDFNQLESRTTEIVAQATQIFPSPTHQVLNIVSDQTVEQIQIFDITGKLLHTKKLDNFQQSMQIDVQHLKGGHYILQLIAANYTESLQFVKE